MFKLISSKQFLALALLTVSASLSSQAHASFFGCDALIQRSGHSHFYADATAARNACESVSPSGACFATGRVNSSRPLPNHTYYYCTNAGSNDNSTVFFAHPNTPCPSGEPDINTGACPTDLVPSVDVANTGPVRPGEAIDLSTATIANNGGQMDPTAAAIYFSTDSQFDGADTAIATDLSVPSLATGQEHSLLPVTFSAPDVPTGSYFVLLLANTGNVPETNTANNTASVSVSIENSGPDLVLELTTDKDQYEFGAAESIIIDYTVSNSGGSDFPVESDLTIRLVLPENELITNITVPAVNAGESEAGQASIEIPADTEVGNYQVAGEVNAAQAGPEEEDYGNNATTTTIEVAGRDLALTLTADATNIAANQTVTITAAVTNSGTLPFDETTLLEVFLATDPELELGSINVGPFEPGDEIEEIFTYTAPADVVPDTYTISAIVNEAGDPLETSFENNAIDLDVIVDGPDLVPTITLEPETVEAGQNITISYTVANEGEADFTRATTLDITVPLGATELTETISIPALTQGTETTGSTAITVPEDTPLGNYDVNAVVNLSGEPPIESNSDNNETSASFEVAGRDLALTLAVDPNEVGAGETVTITATVTNNGGIDFDTATPLTLTFVADSETDISAANIGPIGAGATVTQDISFTVPSDTSPGDYSITGAVNEGEDPVETNYSNNTDDVSITVAGPDLVLGASTAQSEIPITGDVTVTVDLTVNNLGAADFPGDVRLTMSLDGTILAERDITPPPAGPDPWVGTIDVPFPDDISPGTYSIEAVLNPDRVPPEEASYDNNSKTVTVTLTGADPTVSLAGNITNPLLPNQQLEVDVTLQNVGNADHPSNISGGLVLQGNAETYLVGTFFQAGLNAGETSSTPGLVAEIPATVKAGSYQLSAVITSAPEDVNESNNTAGTTLSIEIAQEKENPNEVDCGNPVSVNSGTKKETETDYLGTGAFPLNWMRYYSSSPAIPNGWRFSYSRNLILSENNGVTSAILVLDNGQRYEFDDVDAEGFSDPDVPGLLTRTDSGFVYFDADGNYHYFDTLGRLTAVENLTGFVKSLAYTDDRLTSVTDPFGKTLTVAYNAENQIESVTFPDGRQAQYVYADSLLIGVINADGTQRSYLYESTNLEQGLTGIIDENGNRYATFAYDQEGRAILSTHEGTIDQFVFEYGENQTRITNPLGKSTTFFFEELQGLNQIVRTEGDATFYCPAMTSTRSYDDRGFVVEETDKNGNVTQYTYTHTGLPVDQYLYHVGLVTSRTDAVGTSESRTTNFEWHPEFRIPVRLTQPGRQIDFVYDDQARLIQRTETDLSTGAERIWRNTYNASGLLSSIDGPRTDVADVTTFSYNAEGELIQVINALGHTTQVTAHDANGLPTEVIDANGLLTQLGYDAQLRLTTQNILSTDGATSTQIGYDQKGNVTSILLPDGQTLTYGYDRADRLTSITNSLGESIEFTLDANGNRIGEITRNDSGSIVRRQNRVFDELSRLINSIGAASQTTEFVYDNNDNLTDVIDALGRQTSLSFDGLDRLIRVTDALNEESTFTYDDRDNLIEVVDASGVATQYTYDGLNNLTSESSTARGTTTYEYDAAGNRIQATDANGTVMRYRYDALNRLTRIDYSDSKEERVVYKYDQREFGLGRLTTIKDASGKTRFKYDQRGNLIRDTRTIRDEKYKTRYSYNLANQLTQVIYPSGRIVRYTLDDLSRVVEITTQANKASPIEVVASGFEYLPFGPAVAWTHGNGLTTNIAYDEDYRVSQINISDTETVLDLAYTYDAVSNITSVLDLLDGDSQTFSYDTLNRLASASGAYGDIDYTYDAVGNRLTRNVVTTEATTSESYVYEPGSHRLNEVTRTENGVTSTRNLSYDQNGNTVVDQNVDRNLTYQYNKRNRMEEVRSDGKRVGQYEYNGLGQRVAKTYRYPESETTSEKSKKGKSKKSKKSKKAKTPILIQEKIVFIYDQLGNVIAEARNDEKVIREYIYLGNYRVAMVVNEKTKEAFPDGKKKKGKKNESALYFLHNDHLGTTQKVTNEAQQVAWDSTQKPFGELSLEVESIRMPMRFPGQYADLETGLSYNYFRDYAPGLGRYVQSDPIGLAGGINTRTYGLNQPIGFADPKGLWVPLIGAAANAALDGYSQYQEGNGWDPSRTAVALVTGAAGGAAGQALAKVGGAAVASGVFNGAQSVVFQAVGNTAAGAALATFQGYWNGETGPADARDNLVNGGTAGIAGYTVGAITQGALPYGLGSAVGKYAPDVAGIIAGGAASLGLGDEEAKLIESDGDPIPCP